MSLENVPYRHRFRSIAELHREADLNFAEDGGLAPLPRVDIVESDAEQFEPASTDSRPAGRLVACAFVIGVAGLIILAVVVSALLGSRSP